MVTASKPGRPRSQKLEEYRRLYGITSRQVSVLGGLERLDAMSEDARQVLANRLQAESRARWRFTSSGSSEESA